MALKLSNNATGRLANNLSNTETTLVLQPGQGIAFPILAAGDWFPLTVLRADGAREIMRATAISGDMLTVVRGQENTSPLSFIINDRAELRLTAGALAAMSGEILAASLLPPGTGPIPWSRKTLPPGGWIFCDGRVLLPDTPYQALRDAYIEDGFPWGQDGNGNPRIPDSKGRAVAGADNMGGTAANRLTGGTLGAALGAEKHALTEAEMPSHTHGASAAANGSHTHTGYTDSQGAHSHFYYRPLTGQAGAAVGGYVATTEQGAYTDTQGVHSHNVTTYASGSHTHTLTVSNAGSGSAHNNVQPTIVANMIVKV